MFTVALIGADGAGKTTIGQRLEDQLPLPIKYVYMGVNPDSSNLMLPTTRLWLGILRARGVPPRYSGPPDPNRVKARPEGLAKRAALGLKSALGLVNQIVEEWFRQLVVWSYQRRDYIVLLDRHIYFDCYAHEIIQNGSERPLTKRIHGLMIDRFFPKPDLVVCLDAPAEVLIQRKAEGTLELRERRRQEYLQFSNRVDHFTIVNVDQPEDEVAHQVAELIWNFYRSKNRKKLE